MYDPADHDDRLQLGLKGLLNEAELGRLKARLWSAVKSKAERGELWQKLPVGLVHGSDGEVILDPDQSIQNAVRSVLTKFDELGTARKVLRWMLENGVKIPRRIGSGMFSEVRWQEPTYGAVRDLLRNPRYSGAYVFGKSEGFLKIQDGEPRHFRRALPMEKWKVKLPEHHAGYIGWGEYLSHRERLAKNSTHEAGARGAPGRGGALLQGLIRCGRCASRMQVAYRERLRTDGTKYTEIYYRCASATASHLVRLCQRVAASAVDPIVRDGFFKALEPAALDVSAEAMRRLEESSQAADRHWHFTLERSRYEVEKARRQYDQVEPENRLVARELEHRWEVRLEDAQRLEEEFARWKEGRREGWTEEEILELRDLVKDVPALWKAETTKNEDRKEMLRLLIEEVWVRANRKERSVEVNILWKGGCRTTHCAHWTLNGQRLEETTIGRIRDLGAQGLSDQRIAALLNAEGRRRSDGDRFRRHNVMHARRRYRIAKATPQRESGVYNLKQAAAALGLSPACLRKWLRDGFLAAERSRDTREWEVRLTPEEIERLNARPKDEGEWTTARAARFLGIRTPRLLRWAQGGKLTARRVVIGRRIRFLVRAEEVRALRGPKVPTGVDPGAVDGTKEVQDGN